MRGAALAALLLAGCATYTTQQALSCVRATLPLARPALAIAKDCRDAHNTGGDAVLQCIADSVDAALQSIATVEACLPPPAPAKP